MRSICILLLFLAAALVVGCSDQTGPVRDDALGDLDPVSGTAVLKSLDATTPDGQASLELLSGQVEMLDDGVTVVVDVHLRNEGFLPVGLPITVWIGDFRPAEVFPIDADFVTPTIPGEPPYYGWEFGPLDGGDMILEPGEITHFRTWSFNDPGQGPFSFDGWLEAPPSPGSGLGGVGFWDDDGDGVPDPGEDPFIGYAATVTRPNGMIVTAGPDADGRWSVPLHETGLHTVQFSTYFAMPMDPPMTTPNPQHVMITEGPDGLPSSYLDANLGLERGMPFPVAPLHFSNAPADSLHIAPWRLLELDVLDELILALHVGFSGCSPEHPFSLYAVGGFMESNPPQHDLVLVHELDEECDAAWEQRLGFDLTELKAEYMAMYGPGELICNLIGFDGQVHPFRLMVDEVWIDGEDSGID